MYFFLMIGRDQLDLSPSGASTRSHASKAETAE